MFTVCPKCTLTLAVTANDLRVGQGYVRCGRCSNVFNALLTLTEDSTDFTAPPAAATQQNQRTSDTATVLLQPEAAPAAAIDALLSSSEPAPQAAAASGARSTDTTDSVNVAPLMARHARQQGAAAANVATSAVVSVASAPSQTLSRDPEATLDAPRSTELTVEHRIIDLPVPTAPSASPDRLQTESSSDGAIENQSSAAFGTGTFETIILEGDGISRTEEYVPEETVDNERAEISRRLNLDASAHESQTAPPATPVPAVPTEQAAADDGHGDSHIGQAAQSTPSPSDSADQHVWVAAQPRRVETAPAPATTVAAAPAPLPDWASTHGDSGAATTPGRVQMMPPPAVTPSASYDDALLPSPSWRHAWIGALLLLLLGVQGVHHWRNALAASPVVGGLVTRTYAALGAPLEPQWDLGAYDVRQQGAVADVGASDAIHVRLSLANRSLHAQPVPLLRLTLLDRFGKRIASRDLTPSEYWPAGKPVGKFLASDERVDSEIAVRDPGSDSASFELDVCLKDARGVERCLSDSLSPAGGYSAAGSTASTASTASASR